MSRLALILSFAAGLASATGFAPLGLWPVTILGFAALLHIVRTSARMGRTLLIGWAFGVGHFTVGLNWIAHAFTFQEAMPAWFGYGAVFLLSLYLAIYPAMAAGLAWRWGRRSAPGYVLIFAAAWIVTEWLRATMFTGFAWNPLGVIAVGNGLDQAAMLIGTYGVSGLIVLLAGGVLLLCTAGTRRGGALLAGAPVAAAIIGLLSLRGGAVVDPQAPSIRVVQPNIGQQDKHDASFDAINFGKLAALTGTPGAAPRLIFWPEAAVPEFLENELWARRRIASLMGKDDVLLTGGVALIGDDNHQVIGARNSLFALDGEGLILARYDKAHLVPYGEYLPMRPVLSAIGLSRLVPGDLDFWPGPGPQSYVLPGFGKMGVQICYEIIFSGAVIDRRNRPDFLFNPSNDAWFGAWGPPQHLAQARLRAVEEGIPVIRSTPTGISAVVDARGRLIEQLPHQKAGAIETRLPAAGAPTIFAKIGNILPFLLAVILAFTGVAIVRRSR